MRVETSDLNLAALLLLDGAEVVRVCEPGIGTRRSFVFRGANRDLVADHTRGATVVPDDERFHRARRLLDRLHPLLRTDAANRMDRPERVR